MWSEATLRLLAVGDVMLGDHPVCFGHGIRSTIERSGLDSLFEHVRPALENADLLIGNLECVLSDAGFEPNTLRKAEMRGKPEYAAGLRKVGFGAMSLANNHAMQHGSEAFAETVEALRANDIAPLGINEDGVSNCVIIEKSDIQIALVGYSLITEKYCNGRLPYATGDEKTICDHVHELRKQNYVPVVSLHWGEEYLPYPSPRQIHFGHQLVDAGATLILGHHPHVLQGIEQYRHGCIVYSMGNFVFDDWRAACRETLILECEISKDNVIKTRYTPVLINGKYQPTIAEPKVAARIQEKIQMYSDAIRPERQEDLRRSTEQYLILARRAYRKARAESYLYFIAHLYRYKLSIIFSSFGRFVLRRLNPSHP